MKGERLKYQKSLNDEGLIVYVSQDFVLDKQTVRIKLLPHENKFLIEDELGFIVASGHSKNFTVLRSIARKALKNAGVLLQDEVRKRIS